MWKIGNRLFVSIWSTIELMTIFQVSQMMRKDQNEVSNLLKWICLSYTAMDNVYWRHCSWPLCVMGMQKWCSVFSVQSDNLSLCQTHSLVSLIAINSCLSESIPLSPRPQIEIYRSIHHTWYRPNVTYETDTNKWTNEWNENRRENPFAIQLTNGKQWFLFFSFQLMF